ncbi:tetratricopeptide repeat protein [Zunongwangia sp. H14]|uniref:tetratricopeptide repeat protein n=1 Tax=Zunongwangia sp. H14 TaxID=3240792 RepID=UPI0035659ECE
MKAHFLTFIWFLLVFNGNIAAQGDFIQGEKYLQKGEIEKAEAIFKRNKDKEKALEYLADISSFRRDWDDAIAGYKVLVKNHPENAGYNFKLGGAMGLKAFYGSKFTAAFLLDDIKKYLSRAASLDPGHAQSRRALVELYMQLPSFLGGDEALAGKYQKELVKINALDGYLAQAFIFAEKEDLQNARASIAEALALASHHPELLVRNTMNYELAEAAVKYKLKPQFTLKLLKEYLQNYGYKDLKAPEWAYLKMAEVQLYQKNQEKALENVNRALVMEPDFEEAIALKKRLKDMI